ncbi:hypothetical protein IWW45_007911, partial [Coemansia sp. RSA 485]
MAIDPHTVPPTASASLPSPSPLPLPARSVRRSVRRIVRVQLPPASRAAGSADSADSADSARHGAASRWTQSASGAVAVHADVAGCAHNAACAADALLSVVTAISAGNSGAAEQSSDKTARSPIALPSDVIDAIADAVIAATHLSDSRRLAMQRLGAPLLLADESQSALRTLTHVCRAWRMALLPRAWRSVQLTGAGSPSARDMHAFAGACVRRLVVPWGAMAAPVSWASVDDSSPRRHSEGDAEFYSGVGADAIDDHSHDNDSDVEASCKVSDAVSDTVS